MRPSIAIVFALLALFGREPDGFAQPPDILRAAGGQIVSRGSDVVGVDLRGAWIADADLVHVAALKALEALDLSQTQVGPAGLRHLRDLQNVVELRLRHALHVDDDAVTFLRTWRKLAKLDLGGTRISDQGLAVVARLPGLRQLDVGSARISDEGLAAHLSRLRDLESLTIGGNQLTGEGLKSLRRLKNLQTLDLSGVQNTYSGRWRVSLDAVAIAAIASLAHLRTLDLSRTTVEPGSLAGLADLQGIERLALVGCEGIGDGDLATLARLSSLRWIDLAGTPVTDEGLARLRAALPNATVLGGPL